MTLKFPKLSNTLLWNCAGPKINMEFDTTTLVNEIYPLAHVELGVSFRVTLDFLPILCQL
jgi:hypothetical protein